jgi:pimeloyl-ACP methyl ester carboxylesterase
MTTRMAALAAIAALLITACSRNSPPTVAKTPPSTPSASTVVWSGCGGGFECGTIQVPLDYSHPGGATIGIAVARKPATDPAGRIGSVLTNPGGPGASGIQFLRGEASIMTNLNRHFDLVGFDPRGIGQSAPVRCADGPQEDAFNALDSVLDDPQEKQVAIQADKDFAAGCAQRSGNVLPFLDTPSAARDLDVMRAALGDAKLTYLGFSYGTYLGEHYAHLFPTHVRALALDGVIDPTLSANDMLLAQVVGFERNLQAFLADCKARRSAATPCQYAQSGDPATKLNALMQRIDANPMPVGSRMLTRGLAVIGVLTPLYDESTWTYLDQGLSLADQGNGTLLLEFADLYLGRNSNGTYDNQTDANNAVNCLDHPVPSDIAVYDQLGPTFAKASPMFGPATQYSNLICSFWGVKPSGHPGPLTADGAPPILLVGGTNDPATPYAWAQAVNQQMSNSVLLTRQGNGHVSYDKSACAKNAEDDYLISLKVPSAGTVCS